MKKSDVQPRPDAVFLVLVMTAHGMTARPFTMGPQATSYMNRRRENLRQDEMPARIELHRLDGTRRETHGELLIQTLSLPKVK